MKKSFILHKDSLCILDELTNEEAGQLFKAIAAYQNGEEYNLSPILRIAFATFKNQFLRDSEKYEKVSEKRRLSGSKGGKQKVANASKSKQKVANASKSKQKVANVADSDSDSDSDSVSTKVDRVPTFNFKKSLIEVGGNEELVVEWLRIRKAKRLQPNKQAFDRFMREIQKGDHDINNVLQVCVERSWGGFESEWMGNVKRADSNYISKVREYKRRMKDSGYYVEDLGGWENQNDGVAYTFMVAGYNARGLVIGDKVSVQKRLAERPGWEKLTQVEL